MINDVNDIVNKTQCMTFENNPGTCNSYDVTHDANYVHPEAALPALANYNFGKFFSNTFKCLGCTTDNGSDPYLTTYYNATTA